MKIEQRLSKKALEEYKKTRSEEFGNQGKTDEEIEKEALNLLKLIHLLLKPNDMQQTINVPEAQSKKLSSGVIDDAKFIVEHSSLQ